MGCFREHREQVFTEEEFREIVRLKYAAYYGGGSLTLAFLKQYFSFRFGRTEAEIEVMLEEIRRRDLDSPVKNWPGLGSGNIRPKLSDYPELEKFGKMGRLQLVQ